jgi:hypothetical protein
MGNLTQLSVALFRYHEHYGHLPPAYIADEQGRPMHSWRVLLLEFIDASLFTSYHFDEPWDGPNNRKLAVRMPTIYTCPNDHDNQSHTTGWTSYVAVVGSWTAFPGTKSTKRADADRGRGRTIVIAEVANSGINWMEPRDLDVTLMSFTLDDSSRPSISSNDPGGPGVVFLGGGRERLAKDVTPAVLKALLMVHSDEAVGGP